MRKFKYFIDFEKEEKWLGEMAKKGFLLEGKLFGYKFKKTEPKDVSIRIDYRKFKKQEDFIDYITLFEDSGWEHVEGSKGSGTQYFKKMDENSTTDIFSDKVSNAGKYNRLSDMFIQMAFVYLPIFVALITTDNINLSALFHPKQLYMTDGLWEMSGATFWSAFLFETPFALFRAIMWLFFPALIILYLYFAYKARKLYERNR